MTAALQAGCWPADRVSEALEALIARTGMAARRIELPRTPEGLENDEPRLGRFLEGVAAWLGVEAEPVETPYPVVREMLRAGGPLVVLLGFEGKMSVLLVLKGDRRKLQILTPELKAASVSLEEVHERLCLPIEKGPSVDAAALLDALKLAGRARLRVRTELLRERLAHVRMDGVWLIRPAPGVPAVEQARVSGLWAQLATLLAVDALAYCLWLASWTLLGRWALEGGATSGWLAAWALLLLSWVPLRAAVSWSVGRLAISVGTLLKVRLLAGVVRLAPDEVRHQGMGAFLGQVFESESLESSALTGGIQSLLAALELCFAALVLTQGAGGVGLGLLLTLFAGAAVGLSWRQLRARSRWTEERLRLTHDLIEKMAGHRTRRIQESPTERHQGEDREISRYLLAATKVDFARIWLSAVPRGWLVAGLLWQVPFVYRGETSPTKLALSVGGLLLGFQALQRLCFGLGSVATAVVAWRRIQPLFQAAARSEILGASVANLGERLDEKAAGAPALLEVRDVSFKYPTRAEAVLEGASFKMAPGQKVLLTGPSGEGKSTLGSIVSGLRTADSGLVLLGGLDRSTLGFRKWRQRIGSAPQFHENHILLGTFAFNLLMGRRWPADGAALQEAGEICRELGLGPLLGRMPSGMDQLLGETGWQLSHGERSRVFVARALLQNSDVLILDESFGALDPATLLDCLKAVTARARGVVLIAH